MKRTYTIPILTTGALLATITLGSAQILYEETFNGGVASSGGPFTAGAPLSDLGWEQYGSTYSGYFNNAAQWLNSTDSQPLNTTNGVYIGQHRSRNLHYMAFYTSDTLGAGPYGPVSFTDIPFSGDFTFSIFAQLQGNTTGDIITGRFMVQVGSQWYASAQSIAPPTSVNSTGVDFFDPRSLTLNGNAANWNNVLGIGNNGTLLLGAPASSDLTGAITGVGLLEGLIDPNVNSSGWNYADFTVSAVPEPSSLTLLCGAGFVLAIFRRRWRQ